MTFYVEGPETTDANTTDGINDGGLTGGTGIPGLTITGRLDQLYPASYGYQKILLNEGTPTENLMTGVAMHESSYRQFVTPIEGDPDPDLFNLWLDYKIPAKWPDENVKTSEVPRGKYIGLMQVGDPFTDADAWDWTVNTQDAVNKFSGDSKSSDVQEAVNYEGYIAGGNKNDNIPAHKNGDRSAPRSAPNNLKILL